MRPITKVQVELVPTSEADYVSSTFRQSWEELPILLIASLPLGLAIALLLSYRSVLLVSVASVFALVPAWGALCYVVGRILMQSKPHLADLLSAFLHYYYRECLLALPLGALIVALSIALPCLAVAPPIPVISGITLQVLAFLATLMLLTHAVPLLALFDLSLREAWLYSAALLVRWPMVSIGLLSMAFLLALVAYWVGPACWLILPLTFVPFQVNATLMLTKRAMYKET